MSHFIRIGDVARVRSGFAFKSKDWAEDGVPVIKIQNVRGGRVTLEGCSYVSEDVAATAQSYRLQAGDILITMSGEIGSVGRVRTADHMLLNQRVGRFEVAADRVNPMFFAYAIQSPYLKKQMEGIAYGVAQPNISPALIESLPIWLPSPKVQDAIAVRLASIDDLIENSRRRVEILEDMARLIYREWFVDFRFPGHEDVELVDSDLGPIPAGWSVEALSDAADLVMGQSPKSEFYNESRDGLPFHQGVTDFGRRYPEHRKWCTQENRIAQEGDILLSVRAPVGRLNVAPDRMVIGRGLAALRSKRDTQVFLFELLREVFAVEDSMGGGTIFKAITKRDLQRIQVPRPDPELVESFEQAVGPMFELLRNLTFQNRVLGEVRDLLLPRLVSGELDVSELDLELVEVR